MSPYYADDQITLWHGDALATLRQLDSGSVDCCVTSPPYFGLRDYGSAGQYGLESSPAEYVEVMRGLFADVRRVLADDGTLWLNLGDSYSVGGHGGNRGGNLASPHDRVPGKPVRTPGFAPKNLLGIPWRVAFALQDDGWTLRNSIIWHKPNAMPESVRDRLSSDYEFIFLFAKSRKYFFDLDAIREPLIRPEALTEGIVFGGKNKGGLGGTAATERHRGHNVYGPPTPRDATAHRYGPNDASTLRGDTPPGGKPQSNRGADGDHDQTNSGGRNPGSVWTMATRPFPAAHFATYPEQLARRCIMAGCRPGGVVLDPFSGSGTTGLAATRIGRRYVGIDISAEYLDLSLSTRLRQSALFEAEAE